MSAKLPPSARRILAALDQQGPMHRHAIGEMFCRKGWMWSQAATMIAGRLSKPLFVAGYAEDIRDRKGWHKYYRITAVGRAALREASAEPTRAAEGEG